MNVRCPECSTEFELDDSKVPPGGLQVQCTNCHAVFNAQRENPSLPSPRSDGEWLIRQPSGDVFRLRELTTLQRWIVERKVRRDDEISRTGQRWERLGNIVELAAFFDAVEPPPAPLAQPIGDGLALAPAPSAEPARAAPLNEPEIRLGTRDIAIDTSVDPAAPAVPGTGVFGTPPVETQAAWESNFQSTPEAPQTGQWQMDGSGVGHLFEDQDDEEDDFQPSNKRRWLWVALVFLVIGGAGTFYAMQPQTVQRWIDQAKSCPSPDR
ncbi:MAG: zinc-ribbon domain-containing protein, partial [Myxococcota bacterium]